MSGYFSSLIISTKLLQVEPAPYMDFNDPELGAPLSAAPLTIIPRGSSLLSDWPAKNSKYVLR